MAQIEKGPAALLGSLAPPSRISAPEYAEYHMISDSELAQLTRPEAGVLGSFGFMAAGAMIGFAPASAAIWSKAGNQSPPPLELADVVTIAMFFISLAICVICLTVYFLSRWTNRGLVEKIRSRQKIDLSTTTPK